MQIGGDEHTLRTSADPEYTRRCAQLVDERMTQIQRHVGPVAADRAAILAALSLADEWLQAEEKAREASEQIAERIRSITTRLGEAASDG